MKPMTHPNLECELKHNRLVLENCGHEMIPCHFVLIEKVPVKNYPDGSDSYTHGASIYGLVDKGDDAELKCSSFFVKYNQDYWYREFLSGCLDVILALQQLNDYKPRTSYHFSGVFSND